MGKFTLGKCVGYVKRMQAQTNCDNFQLLRDAVPPVTSIQFHRSKLRAHHIEFSASRKPRRPQQRAMRGHHMATTVSTQAPRTFNHGGSKLRADPPACGS